MLVRPNALIHETQTEEAGNVLLMLLDGRNYATRFEFTQAKRDAAIFLNTLSTD
jgi:hypothetical protein